MIKFNTLLNSVLLGSMLFSYVYNLFLAVTAAADRWNLAFQYSCLWVPLLICSISSLYNLFTKIRWNLTFQYTFLWVSFLTCSISCESLKLEQGEQSEITYLKKDTSHANLLTDYVPIDKNGHVNAVIEIPAGTMQKWELNKSNGQIEWQTIDDKPRIINYLGYPGNYGMIPRTLLSKELGGDGDPLDVLVLGPPAMRGQILKCKIIGVLYLLDNGEQDDKLIAVSSDSPLYRINSLDELNNAHKGISEILKLWFSNYKGVGIMESKGFGDVNSAMEILNTAINEYSSNEPKQPKK